VALGLTTRSAAQAKRSADAAERTAEAGDKTVTAMGELLVRQEGMVSQLRALSDQSRDSLLLARLLGTRERWTAYHDALVAIEKATVRLSRATEDTRSRPEAREELRLAKDDHEAARRRLLGVLPTVPDLDDAERGRLDAQGANPTGEAFGETLGIIADALDTSRRRLALLHREIAELSGPAQDG